MLRRRRHPAPRPAAGASPGRRAPVRTPLLLVPGLGNSLPVPGEERLFLLNRGVAPDVLQLDDGYTELVAHLTAAGYALGRDFFEVAYDWRLPVAPAANEGSVVGLSAASITGGTFAHQVDYLGHWLRRAAEAYHVRAGRLPEAVDVIAHSLGNLVTRAYVQSDAHGGIFFDTRLGVELRLPRVRNFVQVSPPNDGASKTWNPVNDNFAFLHAQPYEQELVAELAQPAWRLVRSDLGQINGPTPITKTSVTDPATAQPDPLRFIAQYMPSLQQLLGTYPLFRPRGGEPVSLNDTPLRNGLLLGLNGGPVNAWVSRVGRVFLFAGNSPSLRTPTTVTRETGPGGTVWSLDDVRGPRPSAVGEDWYTDDLIPGSGDGTVPLRSILSTLGDDARVAVRIETEGEVGHTSILTNPAVLDRITLSAMGPAAS